MKTTASMRCSRLLTTANGMHGNFYENWRHIFSKHDLCLFPFHGWKMLKCHLKLFFICLLVLLNPFKDIKQPTHWLMTSFFHLFFNRCPTVLNKEHCSSFQHNIPYVKILYFIGDASYGINLAHPDLKKNPEIYAVIRFQWRLKPWMHLQGKFTKDLFG